MVVILTALAAAAAAEGIAGTEGVVHRVWENVTAMPVPATAWHAAGFRTHDVDYAGAQAIVEAAGYRNLWGSLDSWEARTHIYSYVVIANTGGLYAGGDVWPTYGLDVSVNRYPATLVDETCGLPWWRWLAAAFGLDREVVRVPQYSTSLFAAGRGWLPLKVALELASDRVARHGLRVPWTPTLILEATGPGALADAVAVAGGREAAVLCDPSTDIRARNVDRAVTVY